MAENGRDAKPTLQPFYKEFKRGLKFGPNGIETGVHKFFGGKLRKKPRTSAVFFRVPGSGKYALSCRKFDRNGGKRARRRA